MSGGAGSHGGRGARAIARLAAVALGLLAGLLAAEGLARVAGPPLGAGGRVTTREPGHPFHPARGRFELGGEEGFRPTAAHPRYGPHGAVANDYPLARTPGAPRVLCLGDSVTFRARLLDGLVARAPEVEWWNAGVEGWATRQEAAYLERIGPGIDPDLVLLFLHLNDFEITPVNFLGPDGQLVQFRPDNPRRLWAWGMRRSALYRAWVAWSAEPPDEARLAREVTDSLERMRAECERRGWAFAVAVLPVFAAADAEPADAWGAVFATAEARRARVLAWTEAAGVRAWSLREPVQATAAAGLPVSQVPGDAQHPSSEAGEACAAWLVDRGLLELLPAPSGEGAGG